MDVAIQAEGLRKRFGDTQALDGVDLVARRGTVLGVLGPNGAGKTTAVRILATLLKPDAGTASVGGFDVVAQPEAVRQTIGLTGQYASVDETLSGTQNLVMIGQLLDLPRREARARAKELLSWFGLTDAADRPAVVFLDEPTTGLDPAKREDMWSVVRSLVDDGSTVLLTTQYLEEADALADEITVIDHGRVIAQDTPDGLKRIVGGQTLTVRPLDPTRIDEVRGIVGDIARTTPDSPGRGVISAPVADDAALGAAVRRLDDAGIAVIELSLRLPSLDEVFFALTHHEDQLAA